MKKFIKMLPDLIWNLLCAYFMLYLKDKYNLGIGVSTLIIITISFIGYSLMDKLIKSKK